MATPKGVYLVKNNRLAQLSFDPCSEGPLLKGFTVCVDFIFNHYVFIVMPGLTLHTSFFSDITTLRYFFNLGHEVCA